MHRSIQTSAACAAAAALLIGPVLPANAAAVSPPTRQTTPVAPPASMPASAAQLQDVATRARALAAASNCEGMECPQFDCPRMARQMQQLIDLETYLEEHLKALNAASGAYGAHYASLRGQSHVTQANLTNVQGAIILHRMLHDIGSALLDLASITDFTQGWKDMDENSLLARADSIYETAKDTESLLNTLRQNLTNIQTEINTAGSIAPGTLDTLVAYGVVEPGATTAQVRQGLNDMISQVTDGINVAKDIKETYDEIKRTGGTARDAMRQLNAKGSFRSIGQMIGRIVKTVSSQVLEERRANESAQIEALAAEAGVQSSFYLEWLEVEASRTANLDALAAVREAKAAVTACLNRGCGATSFTRPTIPNFTTTVAGQTTYNWGPAMTQMAGRITTAPLDVGAGVVDGVPCQTPGGDVRPQTGLLAPAAGLLPAHTRQTTRCPACQGLADEINRLQARRAFLSNERDRIMADLDRAAEIGAERNQLLRDAERLNRRIVDGQIGGTGGERRVNIAAARAELDAILARVTSMRLELERLRAREAEFIAMGTEITELNGRLDQLGQQLIFCENRECPAPPPAQLRSEFILNYGHGELTVPDTGIGFQRTGSGGERFAGMGPGRVPIRSLAIQFYPYQWNRWTLATGLSYGTGDEQTSGQIPGGGTIDTGFVYGGLSPDGSSGLFIGNRTLDWRQGTDVRLINLKAKAVYSTGTPFSPFLFVDFLDSQRTYTGWASAEVFGSTLSQTREQKIDESMVGAGIGLQFDQILGNGVRYGGWTSAGVFRRETRLDAWEVNACPLCSPMDRDFQLDFDEEDDGTSITGAIGAYLAWPLSDTVKIGVGADAVWVDEVGGVFNPNSGDQVFFDGLQTGLTTGKADMWNIRIGLSARF
ncbi:hypothetical protein N0B44_32305 [Roseibacterium beibuensis]|uniref:hypothetical protein n=1 Tax=[Roseibacterium] beibuensis TaxID=1193142 RepID=UPI00217E1659|nr:hypothetical protein [Roseibacterium beibuensis]MCS6627596.1 hypothetical protein [Roseibacterium beibuensis]